MKKWIELHGARSLKDGIMPTRHLRRLVRAAGGAEADPLQGPGAADDQGAAGHGLFLPRPDADGALRRAAGQAGRRDAATRSWPSTTEDGVQQRSSSTPRRASTTTARRPPACCRWPSAWCPTEHRGRVFDTLVDKITDETNGHIGTGLIGGQWLMRVLSDNGRRRPGLHDRHAEDLSELGLHGRARARPRSGSCGTATRPTRP